MAPRKTYIITRGPDVLQWISDLQRESDHDAAKPPSFSVDGLNPVIKFHLFEAGRIVVDRELNSQQKFVAMCLSPRRWQGLWLAGIYDPRMSRATCKGLFEFIEARRPVMPSSIYPLEGERPTIADISWVPGRRAKELVVDFKSS